jgi:hypothetical protein
MENPSKLVKNPSKQERKTSTRLREDLQSNIKVKPTKISYFKLGANKKNMKNHKYHSST